MALSCDLPGSALAVAPDQVPDPLFDPPTPLEEATAVLAGGCFWCVEAVFKRLEGVIAVTAGYAGGAAQSADYRTVGSGTTGHAEVIRIRFQPKRISYGQLLKVFFAVAHDPTQLDRQGEDRGHQYRSAIFYADAGQREIASRYIEQLDGAKVFHAPIMTRLEPLQAFYAAEDYHQDYAERNPAQPYIAAVALPKVEKLKHYFGARLKPAHAPETSS